MACFVLLVRFLFVFAILGSRALLLWEIWEICSLDSQLSVLFPSCFALLGTRVLLLREIWHKTPELLLQDILINVLWIYCSYAARVSTPNSCALGILGRFRTCYSHELWLTVEFNMTRITVGSSRVRPSFCEELIFPLDESKRKTQDKFLGTNVWSSENSKCCSQGNTERTRRESSPCFESV